jgi:hypothetical protein
LIRAVDEQVDRLQRLEAELLELMPHHGKTADKEGDDSKVSTKLTTEVISTTRAEPQRIPAFFRNALSAPARCSAA